MSKRLFLLVALGLIVASSAGIVTMINAQEGLAGASVAPVDAPTAATPEARWAEDLVYRTGSGTLWRISYTEGVLSSTDDGTTWIDRTAGLPRRAVFPFDAPQPPLISSFSADPTDDSRVAITTTEAVYLSADDGATWIRLDVKEPLRPNDQLTCVALSPHGPAVAVGTSFHGFFETSDRGIHWIDLSERVAVMQLGGGNYEEVNSVAYSPVDPDLVYFSLGFGKGLFAMRRGARTAERVAFPAGRHGLTISDIAFREAPDGSGWLLEVRTDSERWTLRPETGAWRIAERLGIETAVDPARAARRGTASGKVGIYVSAYKASGRYLDEHLAFLKRHGLNSMVVDCKEDYGVVAYDTRLEWPRRIGAVRPYFKIDELVAKAHAAGIYLIGRILVFRDKGLYNAPGYPYAAWDRVSNEPWRYLKTETDPESGEVSSSQGEYWVDPYCEDVWRYNIDIAREVQDRGFDEIQFDYIRFPSDGPLSRLTWRFQKAGMGKVEALESFLKAVRAEISIPISTDVYGYCGWARISNWVAQNIEVFSRYVDVIQPMFYPSHFPRDFLGSLSYVDDRARTIYQDGSNRAVGIVEGRCLIRPFVQAFRIGGETSFSAATTSTYLVSQVQGALASAASGFTLWNASNDYYMVTVPLGPMIASAAADRQR
ncbi:MAG: hypothetical protein NTU62_17405 [Spirochaetes bacterium]|nr:hypothetical protein [Spirochaetota bacterium]